MFYLIKTIVAALIIVTVTEVSKVNVTLGALIKSLPLVSLISMVWLYLETKNLDQITSLSTSTFWLVLPTLPLFLIFPLLVRQGLSFFPALGLSVIAMILCYSGAVVLYKWLGISF